MAFTAKWTVKRGANNLAQVSIGAGAAEATRDTISLNADVTTMAKGDLLILLEDLAARIHAGPWPPL